MVQYLATEHVDWAVTQTIGQVGGPVDPACVPPPWRMRSRQADPAEQTPVIDVEAQRQTDALPVVRAKAFDATTGLLSKGADIPELCQVLPGLKTRCWSAGRTSLSWRRRGPAAARAGRAA